MVHSLLGTTQYTPPSESIADVSWVAKTYHTTYTHTSCPTLDVFWVLKAHSSYFLAYSMLIHTYGDDTDADDHPMYDASPHVWWLHASSMHLLQTVLPAGRNLWDLRGRYPRDQAGTCQQQASGVQKVRRGILKLSIYPPSDFLFSSNSRMLATSNDIPYLSTIHLCCAPRAAMRLPQRDELPLNPPPSP
jgi:hypothetical protein